MPILSYETRTDGLYIQTDHGRLALTPYSPQAVRVRYTLEPEFGSRPSLVVTACPPSGIHFSVQETPAALVISTAEIQIEIDRQTAAFLYRDAHGNSLTREPQRGGKTLNPVDVVVSVFDEAVKTETGENVDGMRARAQGVRTRVDRQAYHTKLEFEWAEGEALYGLGSHEEGMLNLRGQHQYLYQQNMKAVVPVLVSTRGYGILIDSTSLMTFHDDAFGSYLWTDVDDEMDFYFLYGPEFDQIVHELRTLTGKAPMFPKWAFGYIQSKERYVTQEELLAVAREYRERQLPLDCIVLDWKSWTGDLWGQKTFDPERFPSPRRMTDDLHELNVKMMISIWPIMQAGGDNWKEMHAKGYLLGNQATYNAFDPAARACYWDQANTGLFSQGIDAWWCDCTEPFEADWKGAVKPEPEERMRINTAEAKRYLDPETISAYSLLHSQGIYAGQRRVTSQKRVVNLTRSAYLGQQRYATVTWSGDIAASWETLRRQVAEGLNFCVTGMPYWSVDVGAFFVKNKPEQWFWSGEFENGVDDLGYRELYLRWFQFGTFLPMFRSHGTDTPREIWRFGKPGELIYDSLVKFLHLRYRLLPYLYSQSAQVTQADGTLLRLLAFDFRSDPNCYDVRDQFLLGPALMICPVTFPMVYGPNSTLLSGVRPVRPVYLPAGCTWYDFWTGQAHAGGQTLNASAALDSLPLFVRAGSILPLGPNIQYSGEQTDAPLELRVYAGQDGHFCLYDDEGDNYNYEQGQFATVEVEWHDRERRLELKDRQGSYPGMKATQEFTVTLIDGHQKVEVVGVHYCGDALSVEFKNNHICPGF
jgi:alpha-D-xyloside xylohydrolase